MHNAFWYILLCFISVSLFVYALWKNRDAKLIALYLIMAGFTYAFEYVILVLFNSYYYYPEILPVSYFDNVLGSAFSNAFAVPMIAVFIAAFGLTFKSYIYFVLAIVGIELLFIKLGVYEHYWWTNTYTASGLILMFIVAKKWLKILHHSMSKINRLIAVHFSSMLIDATLIFVLSGILNLYIYRVQWFDDIYRSHIAFATLYVIIQSLLFTIHVILGPKRFYITFVFALLTLTDLFLYSNNILVFLKGWSIFNFILMRLFILSIMFLIDRKILQTRNRYSEA